MASPFYPQEFRGATPRITILVPMQVAHLIALAEFFAEICISMKCEEDAPEVAKMRFCHVARTGRLVSVAKIKVFK